MVFGGNVRRKSHVFEVCAQPEPCSTVPPEVFVCGALVERLLETSMVQQTDL